MYVILAVFLINKIFNFITTKSSEKNSSHSIVELFVDDEGFWECKEILYI